MLKLRICNMTSNNFGLGNAEGQGPFPTGFMCAIVCSETTTHTKHGIAAQAAIVRTLLIEEFIAIKPKAWPNARFTGAAQRWMITELSAASGATVNSASSPATQLRHLVLLARKRVEYPPMVDVRPLVIARVVPCNPFQQSIEHRVLGLA